MTCICCHTRCGRNRYCFRASIILGGQANLTSCVISFRKIVFQTFVDMLRPTFFLDDIASVAIRGSEGTRGFRDEKLQSESKASRATKSRDSRVHCLPSSFSGHRYSYAIQPPELLGKLTKQEIEHQGMIPTNVKPSVPNLGIEPAFAILSRR